MKIGLIDIDSKIPNIALMKLSAYHKSKGDNVEWWKGNLFHSSYDKVYASKVFDFTPMPYELPKDVEIGGSGQDLNKTLPLEIESITDIDYSIYPDCTYSIQRFSTGCVRKCEFCIVWEKEGKLRPVPPLYLKPRSDFIRLIDNNFFANPLWVNAINYLKIVNLPVYFEGIDARTLTEEQAKAMLSLKIYKQIHMAWDNPNDKINWKKIISWIKAYRIMVYVLIGFNTSKEQDMFRIETLRSLKIDPFVMPYDKSDSYQKKFARWVNHKAIFISVRWEDYTK